MRCVCTPKYRARPLSTMETILAATNIYWTRTAPSNSYLGPRMTSDQMINLAVIWVQSVHITRIFCDNHYIGLNDSWLRPNPTAPVVSLCTRTRVVFLVNLAGGARRSCGCSNRRSAPQTAPFGTPREVDSTVTFDLPPEAAPETHTPSACMNLES